MQHGSSSVLEHAFVANELAIVFPDQSITSFSLQAASSLRDLLNTVLPEISTLFLVQSMSSHPISLSLRLTPDSARNWIQTRIVKAVSLGKSRLAARHRSRMTSGPGSFGRGRDAGGKRLGLHTSTEFWNIEVKKC
jgi:hypothetical protein